jgi:hypothetical protein
MSGAWPKPFDLSVGGSWNGRSGNAGIRTLTTSMSMSVFELGFQITGSHTYVMSNGSTPTPYGRVNFATKTPASPWKTASFR